MRPSLVRASRVAPPDHEAPVEPLSTTNGAVFQPGVGSPMRRDARSRVWPTPAARTDPAAGVERPTVAIEAVRFTPDGLRVFDRAGTGAGSAGVRWRVSARKLFGGPRIQQAAHCIFMRWGLGAIGSNRIFMPGRLLDSLGKVTSTATHARLIRWTDRRTGRV
jgi:hypothetical protein